MTALRDRSCRPLPKGTRARSSEEIARFASEVPGWTVAADGKALSRRFDFRDYHATMAFVNAVAWVAHREDHHPDLEVGYNRCVVSWSTHSVGGLSENDFICAAKVDALGA